MAIQARDPRQPDNIDVEVGRRVRVERMARGLSQTELASRIGVTFQQVQKYESGVNRISIGRLTRIGRLFAVDVTYLLGATQRKAPATAPDPRERAKSSEAMRMDWCIAHAQGVRLYPDEAACAPRKHRSAGRGNCSVIAYRAKEDQAEVTRAPTDNRSQ